MNTELCKNVVLIEVSGGVAEVSHAHDTITVFVVDWDELHDGGVCPGCHEDANSGDGKCLKCGMPFDGNVLEFLITGEESDEPL